MLTAQSIFCHFRSSLSLQLLHYITSLDVCMSMYMYVSNLLFLSFSLSAGIASEVARFVLAESETLRTGSLFISIGQRGNHLLPLFLSTTLFPFVVCTHCSAVRCVWLSLGS